MGRPVYLWCKMLGGREPELRELKSANDRAQSFTAHGLHAERDLSFERWSSNHWTCSLALEEMGILARVAGRRRLSGYEDGFLRPIARRRFPERQPASHCRQTGVVGRFNQAEPVVTNNPQDDPELRAYEAFRECLTAVCVPCAPVSSCSGP